MSKAKSQLAYKARIVRRVNYLMPLVRQLNLNIEHDPAYNILLSGKTEDVKKGLPILRIMKNVICGRSLNFDDNTTIQFIS